MCGSWHLSRRKCNEFALPLLSSPFPSSPPRALRPRPRQPPFYLSLLQFPFFPLQLSSSRKRTEESEETDEERERERERESLNQQRSCERQNEYKLLHITFNTKIADAGTSTRFNSFKKKSALAVLLEKLRRALLTSALAEVYTREGVLGGEVQVCLWYRPSPQIQFTWR